MQILGRMSCQGEGRGGCWAPRPVVAGCSKVLGSFLIASVCLTASTTVKPRNVAIGRNLQTDTKVAISEPAPMGGLELTITSSDPSRLLLAKTPDAAGTSSITVAVREGFRESNEFWLQALDEQGDVKYSVSAPGLASADGTATLSRSGIVLVGPFGEGTSEFTTTPRAWPAKVTLYATRLEASGDYAESQFVRGGLDLDVRLTSSDPAVGKVTQSDVKISAATDKAIVQFQPAGAGKTVIEVTPPSGCHTPARLASLSVIVRSPGIGAANDITIGENLQLAAALSLGEPAPAGGVRVTLTSSDPTKLVLAADARGVGKPAITIDMPAGQVSTTYYIQSLARSGTVSHTATAPGYTTRTGVIALAPSGVIITPERHGPPDEAELFRPESAGGRQNMFVALLSEGQPTKLMVHTAYLDPVSGRSADITVQQLRAGLTLPVDLKNTDPSVGSVESRVMIQGGSDRGIVTFKPISVGQTVISVVTPSGFAPPTNATELLAIVRD